jgi:hypothetical protein
MLQLPGRKDEIHLLEFDAEEQELYTQVKALTREKVNALGETHARLTFLNALKWINDLRLICNHGATPKALGAESASAEIAVEADKYQHLPITQAGMEPVHTVTENAFHRSVSALDMGLISMGSFLPLDDNHYISSGTPNTPEPVKSETSNVSWKSWTYKDAQTALLGFIEFGIAFCSDCGQDLSWADHGTDIAPGVGAGDPHISATFHLLCLPCFKEQSLSTEVYLPVCNHFPRCSDSEVLDASSSPGLASQLSPPPVLAGKLYASTKIKALVGDLHCRPQGEKRYAWI